MILSVLIIEINLYISFGFNKVITFPSLLNRAVRPAKCVYDALLDGTPNKYTVSINGKSIPRANRSLITYITGSVSFSFVLAVVVGGAVLLVVLRRSDDKSRIS